MGNITTAVRFENGDIKLRSDRDSTDLFAYPTIFEGDESGAREVMSYPSRYREITSVRENECGVLVVDFPTRRILFNRSGQLIDRVEFFDPRLPFQLFLAQSRRVTLTCPAGSFDPVPILPEMVPSWEEWDRLVNPRMVKRMEEMDFKSDSLPTRYFMRWPRPEFVFDLSPWRVVIYADTDKPENTESRIAFWTALEEIGLGVDRKGWMSDFDDDEWEEDEDDAGE